MIEQILGNAFNNLGWYMVPGYLFVGGSFIWLAILIDRQENKKEVNNQCPKLQ